MQDVVYKVYTESLEHVYNKDIIIEIKQSCDVRIIVFQFRQLLYNLLGNSIKFAMPNVPPHIIIKSNIDLGNNFHVDGLKPFTKYCHISIKDNGIGFEPEYSRGIFEVFQKLYSKEMYKGTDIGLAIVKKIVDNHNGIITATSILGKGATFNIYLPV